MRGYTPDLVGEGIEPEDGPPSYRLLWRVWDAAGDELEDETVEAGLPPCELPYTLEVRDADSSLCAEATFTVHVNGTLRLGTASFACLDDLAAHVFEAGAFCPSDNEHPDDEALPRRVQPTPPSDGDLPF